MYQLPTEDEFFSDDYQLPTADEFFDMSPDESSGQAVGENPPPPDEMPTANNSSDQPDGAKTPGAGQSAIAAGQTAMGAGQVGQAAPCPDEAALDVNDPSLKGAHIYAYQDPNDPKGFAFFAVDDKGSEPVTGYFNRTTYENYNELPSGDYTLSPRPHIAIKSGLEGVEQNLGQKISGNWSGDPNFHEGNPVISNSDDWNTIILPDAHKMRGATIHPGKDPVTGEGGLSLGCMVTTNNEYDKLNRILQRNYAQGGAYLHILPYKKMFNSEEVASYQNNMNHRSD